MSSCPSLALAACSRFPWNENDMDHALWGALPQELVVKILAYMPLHNFLKFRSVCKSWNNLLDNGCFRKSFMGKPCAIPLLVTAFKGSKFSEIYVGYTAATRVWHHPFPPFSSKKSDAKLLATAGGLVLLMTGQVEMIGGQAIDNRRLLVSNPLTKVERELPTMSSFRKPKEFDKLHATMLLDDETNEYMVFVIHIECNDSKEWDGVSKMKAEVLHSKNKYWERRGAIPEEECRWYSISSLLYNKELYCLFTNSSGDVEPSLYRIHSCQKQNDSSIVWIKIDFDLRLTGYHVSAYLYQTGPRLSIAAVTKRLGITMIKISRLQIIEGENRCTVHKPYTLMLSPSDTDYSHSICANKTHVFFMRLPLRTEVNKLPVLLVIKQQWKSKVGEEKEQWKGKIREEELPVLSSLERGPPVAEVDHVLQSFLYEPRLDMYV